MMTSKSLGLVLLVLCVSSVGADVVYLTNTEVLACAVLAADSANVSVRLSTGGIRTVARGDIRDVQVSSWERRDTLTALLKGITVVYVPKEPLINDALSSVRGAGVNSALVWQAGGKLRDARSAFLWSLGLQFATGVAIGFLSVDTTIRSPVIRIAIPLGLELASFICGVAAWVEIGDAGTPLQGAAINHGEREHFGEGH
jgi:hypothetical protein